MGFVMKTKLFTFSFILLLILQSCKTRIEYIPIEKERIEYRDNYLRDSIYMHDSIIIKDKGDSIFIEKFKYLYKDKIIRDSIFIHDSIPVPYQVDVVIREKYVSSFQNFQIWCGRILLLGLLFYIIFKLIKKKFT